MGIGNVLKYSIIATILLVIIGVIGAVIGLIPVVGGFLACLAGPLGWLLAALVLAWAGYSAVKGGSGLLGAAGTGALSGFLGSIITGIIWLVLSMLGIGVGTALSQDQQSQIVSLVGGGFGVAFGLILGIFAIGAWTIGGAIIGAIGGAVAGSPKK